jgi:ribosomal protein L11 methyltransferase
MNNYYCVTLFHINDLSTKAMLESEAMTTFKSTGIEEYNLNENTVDSLLGERSYSGGDLPESILDEVDCKVSLNSSLKLYFSTKLDAENFYSFAKAQKLVEGQIEEFKSEDWNSEWKKHFGPIIVDQEFSIMPSWYKEQKQVFIYPGMGFGTGSHETTWMCLRYLWELEEKSSKNITSLDFGSGSGILGISLLAINESAYVDLIDIDPLANENALKNIELNNLSKSNFGIYLTEDKPKLKNGYDIIFANILLNVLESEGKFLFSKLNPGGKIIISGLLKTQTETLIQTYQNIGFKLISSKTKADWSAVLMEKLP